MGPTQHRRPGGGRENGSRNKLTELMRQDKDMRGDTLGISLGSVSVIQVLQCNAWIHFCDRKSESLRPLVRSSSNLSSRIMGH